ncbi:MAG TPA: hypothetical protein VES00_13770 [Burkholderiaceae bacterium]|nr:hypothetical protein [Burkholderiaceae bacterium]
MQFELIVGGCSGVTWTPDILCRISDDSYGERGLHEINRTDTVCTHRDPDRVRQPAARSPGTAESIHR